MKTTRSKPRRQPAAKRPARKLRTILVVYSNTRLTPKQTQTLCRYSFNTKDAVKVGTRFSSPDYQTAMQVVEVMAKTYRYVNTHTGDLSNTRAPSTKQYEIRVVEIEDPQQTTVTKATRFPYRGIFGGDCSHLDCHLDAMDEADFH